MQRLEQRAVNAAMNGDLVTVFMLSEEIDKGMDGCLSENNQAMTRRLEDLRVVEHANCERFFDK